MADRPDDGSPERAGEAAEGSSPHHERGRGGHDGEGNDSAPSRQPRDGTVDRIRAGANAESGTQTRAPSVEADRRPRPEPGTRAATPTARPDGWTGFAYDVGTSILAVLLVGGFLFAVSGVWPPLVAVESGSMVPNMQKGDLVFVMEEHRFAGNGSVGDAGVVTARSGERSDYRRFGGYGDVIVYNPGGSTARTPIIHRAMLYVEEGDRWVSRADPDFLDRQVCETDEDPDTDTGVRYCPAPYDGFITKGDNNNEYDQSTLLSPPVKPDWVVGTAELRFPGLGWIRLGSR